MPLSICMVFAATLSIAKAAEPQTKSAELQSKAAKPPAGASKIDDQQTEPSFKIRKLVSVPTRDKDDFTRARVAVSLDQKAVISRNYIVSRGENSRDRIGAYLWSLNPDDPKRTKLPDSTTFGFIPNSNLAYQVSWGDGVRFWDTRTHTRSGDYIPHELREDTTIGPAISPSGKLMVTRSQLDRLQFWNIETRKPISNEIKQTGNVYSMGFSRDGKWFFSKASKRLTIWEPRAATLVAERLRHDIPRFVYSSNSNQVVTVTSNFNLHLSNREATHPTCHATGIMFILSSVTFTSSTTPDVPSPPRMRANCHQSWCND